METPTLAILVPAPVVPVMVVVRVMAAGLVGPVMAAILVPATVVPVMTTMTAVPSRGGCADETLRKTGT